jgi:O-antigen ligase
MTFLANLAVRAPALLVPLLMLTIPLEFTAVYFPNQIFQVGRLVMVLCIVAFLVGAVSGEGVRLPVIWLWLPALAYILYAAISASASGSVGGLKTVGAALTYALVALAIYNWTRTRQAHDRVWTWLAVSCIGLSLIGIFQRITGFYIWNAPDFGFLRVNATFADPNTLGRVLTCMIVAGVALIPRLTERRVKGVIAAAVLLSAATLPFTLSRQAWIIGGLTLVLVVLTADRRKEVLGFTAAVVAVFALVSFIVPDVAYRFGVLQQNLTGAPAHIFERPGLGFLNYLPLDSERHYLIAAGLQMFYDHPIFGVGFGKFSDEIVGAYRGFILPGYRTTRSHTSLVTVAAELGLTGLLLLGWWGFEFIRRIASAIRGAGVGRAYILAPMFALFVIFLESQFSERLIDEPYLWLFVGLACAAMDLETPVKVGGTVRSPTAVSVPTIQNSRARSLFQ